jgi:hypothetical protein
MPFRLDDVQAASSSEKGGAGNVDWDANRGKTGTEKKSTLRIVVLFLH